MADSNAEAYQKAIWKVTKTILPSKWEEADWSEAVALIDQSVLDNAHACSEKMVGAALKRVCSSLKNNTLFSVKKASVGPPKQLSRVEEKKQTKGLATFKVICDLMRARVETEVKSIHAHLNAWRLECSERGWKYHIRGGGYCGSHAELHEHPCHLVFKDIVQFVYLFLPKEGFFVELQIMEPVAAHTFHIDSLLRSWPTNLERPVDLWEDELYLKIRQHILALANGVPPATSVKELKILATCLYRKHNSIISGVLLETFMRFELREIEASNKKH